MNKLKSISKKAKTIAKSGIEPYQEGKHNFENVNPDVEALALRRSEICSGCEFFKTEPIKQFMLRMIAFLYYLRCTVRTADVFRAISSDKVLKYVTNGEND